MAGLAANRFWVVLSVNRAAIQPEGRSVGLSVAAAVEVLWQRSRWRRRLEGQSRYLGCVRCVWSLIIVLLHEYSLSGNAGTALARS